METCVLSSGRNADRDLVYYRYNTQSKPYIPNLFAPATLSLYRT